jgi:AcrR family transcriptional regulator
MQPARNATPVEVRRALQASRESIRTLARRYGLNPKTVAKWRGRASLENRRPGPARRSTALSAAEEALVEQFCRVAPLPLDEALIALRTEIQQLSRSTLYRCLRRHGLAGPDAKPRPYRKETAVALTKLLERQLNPDALHTEPIRTTNYRNEEAPAASPQPRPKAREATRDAILEAARILLSKYGPEGLSLSQVARTAGVNRGTLYQHFASRDALIKASAEQVSQKLFDAIFGAIGSPGKRPVEDVDVADLTDRLAYFAMDNPALSQAWLFQVLSSPEPASDMFWREYEGSTEKFTRTPRAKPNVDSAVLTVIMLAGASLWPVWARAHAGPGKDLRPYARRFAQECLRISMYGNLRAEYYPQIAERLQT